MISQLFLKKNSNERVEPIKIRNAPYDLPQKRSIKLRIEKDETIALNLLEVHSSQLAAYEERSSSLIPRELPRGGSFSWGCLLSQENQMKIKSCLETFEKVPL